MKIEIEIDEVQVWQTVFGSSPFSFGSWWTDCVYLYGSSWEKPGKVRLTATDEITGEKTTKTISAEDLVRALPAADKQTNIDMFNFEEYDSVAADALLQVAVFGKVIWG